MTLIWSAERMMELIDEMKYNRCLWDPNDKYRKNKDIRDECFNKIALKFDTTPGEIKRKIESLVQSYRVYRRKAKLLTAKAIENGESQPYEPTWFAYSAMHQLLKRVYIPRDELESALKADSDVESDVDIVEVIKEESPDDHRIETRETDSNTKDNFHISEEYHNFPMQTIKIPKTEPVEIESSSHHHHNPHNNNDEDSKQSFEIIRPSKRPAPPTTTTTTRRPDEEDTRLAEVYDYFIKKKKDDEFTDTRHQLHRIKDECDIYGELVATKLRKMNELTRQCVMNEMDNLMFRALLNSNYQTQQGRYPFGAVGGGGGGNDGGGGSNGINLYNLLPINRTN